VAPFARPGDRRTGPVSPVPTSANGTGGTRRPSAAPRTRRPSSPRPAAATTWRASAPARGLGAETRNS